jgi:hypothetical protein
MAKHSSNHAALRKAKVSEAMQRMGRFFFSGLDVAHHGKCVTLWHMTTCG